YFVAEFPEKVQGFRSGTQDLVAVTVSVIVSGRAMRHDKPVKIAGPAIKRRASGKSTAIGAIGDAKSSAEILPIFQKIVGADGLIAHRTGSGGETGIGSCRASLYLYALQEYGINNGRPRMVPTGRRLRHTIDCIRQIRLLHSEDVNTFGRSTAARDRDRRFARK